MGFAQMMEVFEKLPEETRKAFIMLMEEFEKRFNLMEKMATKDEMNSLKEVVAELAEAQKRTEEKLNELAEAQRRTEETLNALLKRQKIYERKVDGLSHSFGFLLEDRAIQSLPEVLGREGIKAIGRLRSMEIELDKEYDINIYGLVEEDGKKKVLLGECKSKASKKELQRFLRVVGKVKDYVMAKEKVNDVFLVFVVHRISNKLRKEFEEVGVKVYESYELKI